MTPWKFLSIALLSGLLLQPSSVATAATVLLDGTPASCQAIGGSHNPNARFQNFVACFIGDYSVPSGTVLRIESDVDLEVRGTLTIEGTLENFGVLYVQNGFTAFNSGSDCDPSDPAIVRSSVVNRGTLENFGFAVFIRSDITNEAGGRMVNHELADIGFAGGHLDNAGDVDNVRVATFSNGGALAASSGRIEFTRQSSFDVLFDLEFVSACLVTYPESGPGTMTNLSGGTFDNAGEVHTEGPDDGELINLGTINNHFGFIENEGVLTNDPSGTINNGRIVFLGPGSSFQSDSASLTNASDLAVDVRASLPDYATIASTGTFTNDGTLNEIAPAAPFRARSWEHPRCRHARRGPATETGST